MGGEETAEEEEPEEEPEEETEEEAVEETEDVAVVCLGPGLRCRDRAHT